MTTQPGLSQQELDWLLEQWSEPGGGGGVHAYRFTAGSRLLQEHLRTVELVHTQYAQILGGHLSALMQTRVQAEVGSVAVLDLSDLIQSLPNPTVVGVFQLEPLPGNCLLELSPDLGYAMIEKFFGGRLSYFVPRRAMTELELGVMERLLKGALGGLEEAWAKLFRLKPVLMAVETNPLMVQRLAMGDSMVRVILRVQMRELRGHLQLAVPAFVLEPILDRLSRRTWYAADGSGAGVRSREMTAALDEVEVTLAAVLGEVRLPPLAVASLAVGQVLVLDQGPGDPVQVRVEGQPRFRGQPCRLGQQVAVQIRAVVPEMEVAEA